MMGRELMDRETMEYALDQNVVFEHGVGSLTGKITGHFGDNFIITLDQKLDDGRETVLVPALAVRPLTCHWCRDSQKVYATPYTLAQAESGNIPTKDCPYCTKTKT
jgi:hypothetical protein